jgi:hypothetical protein
MQDGNSLSIDALNNKITTAIASTRTKARPVKKAIAKKATEKKG